MKIAIVTETFLPSTDGVVVRLVKEVDYLLKVGHEVLIIAPEVEGVPADYKGARIIGAKSHVFPFYKERPWALPTTKIEKWLEEFDPDIVHCANPISLGACGVHYAEKLGIPLICSFHTNIPEYLSHYHLDIFEPIIWTFLRSIHNKSKINLVTSQAMYDMLDENGIQGLRVIPKGVDLDNRDPKFYSDEMRHRLTGGDPKKKALIFVGRLAAEKEVHRLRPIMDMRDDIHLTIVGDGPETQNLKDLFAGTATTLTGFVHGRELSEIYASADGFVFPSVTETLGLVIAESMASATPVIAAKSAPSLEQIDDRKNGLIFDAESVESLNKSIDMLYDDLLMTRITKAGLEYAKDLSWDKASHAILEAYVDTLELVSDAKIKKSGQRY